MRGRRFISSCQRPKLRSGRILLVLGWLLVPLCLQAQNSSRFEEVLTPATGDTVRLSHAFLSPNSCSFRLGENELTPGQFELNELEGWFILKDNSLSGQELTVQYRYFPKALRSSYAFRTRTAVKDTAGNIIDYTISGPGVTQMIENVDLARIRKSGSISRGITVGNNQNLTVTSGLRLQIDGDLGDGLTLSAAITDENIPIQPDGTTAQISDFDKVYVQVSKDDDMLILGDFELNQQHTNFANFYRNVQGIGVRIAHKGVKGSASGAVAKGTFNTNSFQGRDGVLGPYRLSGKSGERFIIVLAGSEKVFINGKMMNRGEANDYTIDYNTGELTFTSQQVITNVTRIVVDFEYTDRFYNRSLLFAEVSDKLFDDKLDVFVSYGRDADNQNEPLDLDFSQEDRDTLRAAGDDPTRAASSGIDSVGFAENGIRYQRIDTTVFGVTYEAYIYSVDPDTARFALTFSFVGENEGLYVLDNGTLNGSVYQWVGPDSTGELKGSYMPIKTLRLPKLLQVADFKLNYQLTKRMSLYTELAVSSEDKNRLSPLQDEDNVDFANKTGLRMEKIKLGDSTRLKIDVSHRYVGKRYTNLDRVYKVEYGREWNFNDLGTRDIENVTEGVMELNYKNQVRLTANGGFRRMGTDLFSIKQLYKAQSDHKWLQGNHVFTSVTSRQQSTGSVSRWDRHNGDIHKRLGKLQPGVEVWIENKTDKLADTTTNGSFRFYDLKPYLKTIDTDKLKMTLWFNYRNDYEFFAGRMRQKSEAYTEYLKLVYRPIPSLSIQNTTSLRDFFLRDAAFAENGLNNSKTLVNNFQGTYRSKNQLIYANGIYEATSEQLARKDVAYIPVNTGNGQYIWEDINGNEIQELDEFQLAPIPSLGEFVRVIVPTRELFPTTALNLAGNLKLSLKRVVSRSKNPFRETLRNITTITNFRAQQKKEAGREFSNYLVDLGNIFGDTTLLEANYSLKQDLYFFQNNKRGTLRFTAADIKSKQFLTSGSDLKGNRYFSANQRINLGKERDKSLENEFRIGEKLAIAENFDTRNFNIHFWEIMPRINFQVSDRMRLSGGYVYKDKDNLNADGTIDAKVNIHKLVFDGKVNVKKRNNLMAKLEFVQVLQDGELDFSADYEMKESLQEGFNALWQIFGTWYLTETLELSVTYDGRASEGRPVLHTGRMQIKAFFQ